jgi:hypothetical protein
LVFDTAKFGYKFHVPSHVAVEYVIMQRKLPKVRICRLRNQAAVGHHPLTFGVHATMAGVLDATLIRHQVVQVD